MTDGDRDPADVLIPVLAAHFLQTGKNVFLAQVKGRLFENLQRGRAGIPFRVLANRVGNEVGNAFGPIRDDQEPFLSVLCP